jgi:hypothetical protein
MSFDMSL